MKRVLSIILCIGILFSAFSLTSIQVGAQSETIEKSISSVKQKRYKNLKIDATKVTSSDSNSKYTLFVLKESYSKKCLLTISAKNPSKYKKVNLSQKIPKLLNFDGYVSSINVKSIGGKFYLSGEISTYGTGISYLISTKDGKNFKVEKVFPICYMNGVNIFKYKGTYIYFGYGKEFYTSKNMKKWTKRTIPKKLFNAKKHVYINIKSITKSGILFQCVSTSNILSYNDFFYTKDLKKYKRVKMLDDLKKEKCYSMDLQSCESKQQIFHTINFKDKGFKWKIGDSFEKQGRDILNYNDKDFGGQWTYYLPIYVSDKSSKTASIFVEKIQDNKKYCDLFFTNDAKTVTQYTTDILASKINVMLNYSKTNFALYNNTSLIASKSCFKNYTEFKLNSKYNGIGFLGSNSLLIYGKTGSIVINISEINKKIK